MELYIFTRGREDDQVTYRSLPPSLRTKVNLVIYEDEAYAYNTFPKIITVPSFPKGIGYKRQWVMERCKGRAVFMDDDLTFAKRRLDDPSRFTECTNEDMEHMFHQIEKFTTYYVHSGVAMREGANRNTNRWLENTRICRFHIYDTKMLRAMGIRFDRLPLMEDFDVSLQCLRQGYANRTINRYVQNQGGSQRAGGVSSYRTHAMQAEAAYALAELHPDFVTAVEKDTKEAWGGGTRTDVRIQWKRAFEEGCKLRGTTRGTI